MENEKRPVSERIAQALLEIKAVKLQPGDPFRWASGQLSPIYCDNRLTLSYPELRTLIKESLAAAALDRFPGVEAFAGVATAGIPQAALVAEHTQKSMVYVRSASKGHGLQNRIEGFLPKGQKVVVIEDLVSTGKSSLEAVDALREAGADVLGMLSVFTYGFEAAADNLRASKVVLHSLSDYETMIAQAIETGYVSEKDAETLRAWRKAPKEWNA